MDASSIPYSDVFGKNIRVVDTDRVYTFNSGSGTENKILKFASQDIAVPGICVLDVSPSIGDASDRNSPANVAATALYTHVRYMNSGRKNYDQADLMIYGLTAADLYSFINWMIRIYNCAFIFSQRNTYVGKDLLEAQGVSPSIIEDLPALRYWINVFINKVASYAVPDEIYLYRKRAFMYANVYSESPSGSIKDQLYMYNPHHFYRFTLDDHEKGSLELINVKDGAWYRDSNGYLTLQGLRAIGDRLLSDMWGDEDFGIMAGDVLRAFDGKIVALSQIGAEGGLLPLYDPYVLHQMKNSTLFDQSDDSSERYYRINISGSSTPEYQYCKWGNVYQDGKGNLVSHHFLSVSTNGVLDSWPGWKRVHAVKAAGLLRNVVLSVDAPSPEPALNVEITRNISIASGEEWINLYDYQGNKYDDPVGILVQTGDAIITGVRIKHHSIASTFKIGSSLVDWEDTSSDYKYWYAACCSNFEYMPMLWRCGISTSTSDSDSFYEMDNVYPLADLKNYTAQSADVIIRLHELSMLSLLYVPGVAKQVNYMK